MLSPRGRQSFAKLMSNLCDIAAAGDEMPAARSSVTGFEAIADAMHSE
jgi:hypothetical protein